MERATFGKPNFHEELKRLMDDYVHDVYRFTRKFPREEQYGSSSQLRRASLSIVLNYIEGYARRRDKVYKNFLEISYGSLKESQYLVEFAYKEKFISEADFQTSDLLAARIGAMVWGILRKMN